MGPVTTPVVWQRDRPFEVQGHRGARGLRPENTLAGIACALEIGVGSVECDVALTEDDVVILTHDGAVPYPVSADATSATRTAVGRLPLAELRRLDLGESGRSAAADPASFRPEPGQRMTTLGGVLALFELFDASDVRLDVEIKSARHSDPGWDPAHVVERVVAEMRAHGAVQMCSLRSFDLDVQREAREQCPELARVLLVGTAADRVPGDLALDPGVTPHDLLDLARAIDAAAVAPGKTLVTPELVRLAHAERLPVIPWTVNDPATARALLRMGVDGMCTDRPDLLRATLAGEGLRLPARHQAPSWLGYGWQAWPDDAVPALHVS